MVYERKASNLFILTGDESRPHRTTSKKAQEPSSAKSAGNISSNNLQVPFRGFRGFFSSDPLQGIQGLLLFRHNEYSSIFQKIKT